MMTAFANKVCITTPTTTTTPNPSPLPQVGSTGRVIGVEAQRNLAALAAHTAVINGQTHVQVLNAAIDSSISTCLMSVHTTTYTTLAIAITIAITIALDASRWLVKANADRI